MGTLALEPKAKHVIHTLDNSGDMRLMWDAEKSNEVKAARVLFDSLKGKHYTAYRAEGKEGNRGEVIRDFDPNAERIIMVPRMVGG